MSNKKILAFLLFIPFLATSQVNIIVGYDLGIKNQQEVNFALARYNKENTLSKAMKPIKSMNGLDLGLSYRFSFLTIEGHSITRFKTVGAKETTPTGVLKEYGVISVLLQAFYEGEYLFTVDKSNFDPPPKVQSGVIRLTRKTDQELGCPPELFRIVVKTAFGQRRKMLRNTMKSMINNPDLLADEFFNLRPEVLSVADFVKLTKWVIEYRA